MPITQSRRREFTGAHLDPRTKQLIRYVLSKIVAAQGSRPLSMSIWISDAVEEKLARDVAPAGVTDAALRDHLLNLKEGRL